MPVRSGMQTCTLQTERGVVLTFFGADFFRESRRDIRADRDEARDREKDRRKHNAQRCADALAHPFLSRNEDFRRFYSGFANFCSGFGDLCGNLRSHLCRYLHGRKVSVLLNAVGHDDLYDYCPIMVHGRAFDMQSKGQTISSFAFGIITFGSERKYVPITPRNKLESLIAIEDVSSQNHRTLTNHYQ